MLTFSCFPREIVPFAATVCRSAVLWLCPLASPNAFSFAGPVLLGPAPFADFFADFFCMNIVTLMHWRLQQLALQSGA